MFYVRMLLRIYALCNYEDGMCFMIGSVSTFNVCLLVAGILSFFLYMISKLLPLYVNLYI